MSVDVSQFRQFLRHLDPARCRGWDKPPDYKFVYIGVIAVALIGILSYTTRRH